LLRVYLAGEVILESGSQLVREADLPGRQGRLALAHLVVARANALPREELAETLWPGALPRAWDTSLSAIISKLRLNLEAVGLDRDRVIPSAFGCYQLKLPDEAWIDLEVAAAELHAAEGEIRAGNFGTAYGSGLVAIRVLRRPLLPGADGPWVQAQREIHRARLVRALECMVACLADNGEVALALRNATELVAMEPFRESGYRHLMRLHASEGDRADALLAYEACRTRLADELGVGPSAETEALHVEILKS
jgi:DNA-binding SARP family transcriptional activator